jgi:hypothetical protein
MQCAFIITYPVAIWLIYVDQLLLQYLLNLLHIEAFGSNMKRAARGLNLVGLQPCVQKKVWITQ